MSRILWVGDAGVATGFARATHYILEEVRKKHEVFVLGINYLGDPHTYPYPIFPAMTGGDTFGVYRVARIAKAFKIDCIVIQNDVWNIQPYIEELKKAKVTCPVVGVLPVDGKNCQGWKLNDLSLAIFWTQFGQAEATLGGMTCPSTVIPLGVDLDIYHPIDQVLARNTLDVRPESKAQPKDDSFIVLNVNRNQLRKRFDLTIEYFCDWIEQYGVKDAFLMFHACPTDDDEFDIAQLMEYRGHRDKLMLFRPNIGYGVSEEQLVYEYNMADVMISTTQGEGFGLTTFEGMACGIPQIVPDWASLGELTKGAARLINCTSHAVTTRGINAIGGIADKCKLIDSLNDLYRSRELRRHYRELGLQRVSRPEYRWSNVGQRYTEAISEILNPVMVLDQTILA